MKLYCTDEFKRVFEALSKKRAYATLEPLLLAQYCHTTYAQACTGDPLALTPTTSYLKKRLGGKGGYRAYILGVVQKDAIYLAYLHPKTGPDKLANISTAKKKQLLKDVLTAIKSGSLHNVGPDPADPTRLKFT